MRYLTVLILLLTAYSTVLGQSGAGLHYASDTELFVYSGPGWTQIVDGAYTFMHSDTMGDSVTFDFIGDSVIVYRDLSVSVGALASVCLNGECSTFSNSATSEQQRIPIAFSVSGTLVNNLTMTNLSGTFSLSHVIVMPESGLNMVNSPAPSVEYFTLSSGRVVGLDFSITGGEIAIILFLAFIGSMLFYSTFLNWWSKHE